MTRLAQASEVVEVVGAAVVEREDVVNFLHGRVPSTGQAVLAQRVGVDVGRAVLSPPVVVASVDLWVALVLAVAGVLGARVLGTEPCVGQLPAAKRSPHVVFFLPPSTCTGCHRRPSQ